MPESKNIPLTDEVTAELGNIQREIQKLQQIANAVIFGFRSARGVPKDWTFNGTAFVEPEKPKEAEK